MLITLKLAALLTFRDDPSDLSSKPVHQAISVSDQSNAAFCLENTAMLHPQVPNQATPCSLNCSSSVVLDSPMRNTTNLHSK